MTDSAIIEREASFGDYFALLKPRVMSLVVFTALVGLVVAPAEVHPMVALASILFIAVGAGAAGALNMWWDADIDGVMRRTSGRPVPSGRVDAKEALTLGAALAGFAVMMLALAANLVAAGLLAFTIFFYIGVYTIWLKRWTPQNIVIGGAAGSFPPMIGWAVATGGVSVESLLMFALIFLWTPPHFWSLALFIRSDYDDAQVPMLTVTHGRASTRVHVFAYTMLLVPFSLALALSGIGGPATLAVAIGLNLWFVRGAWAILWRDEAVAEADRYAAEKAFFRVSLYYLFFHFGALLVDATLRGIA